MKGGVSRWSGKNSFHYILAMRLQGRLGKERESSTVLDVIVDRRPHVGFLLNIIESNNYLHDISASILQLFIKFYPALQQNVL